MVKTSKMLLRRIAFQQYSTLVLKVSESGVRKNAFPATGQSTFCMRAFSTVGSSRVSASRPGLPAQLSGLGPRLDQRPSRWSIGWVCVDLDPPQRYWSYITAAHGIVLEEFDKYTATNSTYNCVRNKTLMANVTTTVWTNSIIGSVNSDKQLMIGATEAMGIDASSILFKQY